MRASPLAAAFSSSADDDMGCGCGCGLLVAPSWVRKLGACSGRTARLLVACAHECQLPFCFAVGRCPPVSASLQKYTVCSSRLVGGMFNALCRSAMALALPPCSKRRQRRRQAPPLKP